MTKKQLFVVLLVALFGGLVGGVISDRLAIATTPENLSGPAWACKFIVAKDENSLGSAILEDQTASMDGRTQLIL